MELTLTGSVLIPLTLVLMFAAPRSIVYLLIAFTAFSGTALVNVTSYTFGLQPTHWLSALAGLLFLFGALSIPRTGHAAAIGILLIVFFASIVLSIFSKVLGYQATISNLTQALIALDGLLITAVVAFFVSTPDRLITAIDVIVASAVFVSAWGLLQLAAGTMGFEYPAILFNNSISDSADMFAQDIKGVVRISAVAIEPSFFARYAVAATGIALFTAEVEAGYRRAGFYLAACFIGLTAVLSTSTSAYIGLAVVAALWVASDMRRLIPLLAIGAIGLSLLSIVDPDFVRTLWSVTAGKTASGSFYDRLGSVVSALETFDRQPLFGHGWDELASLDLLGALLFHTGILGWLSFLALLVYALMGGLRPALAESQPVELTRLSGGMRMTLLAVVIVDAVSGISYVAANLWVTLGLTLAVQGIERSVRTRRAKTQRAHSPRFA
ncbi:hypothetical protein H9Q09_05040 [Aurantimonas sp. DM33-3]|uniref:hypothetical protein n=1 Tax=Aurantimonas sp. DM33-3 TaxID=2766955 RepID=UPI0016526DDD|nr:hypothetical protein [Aurantimonas sp. DM33-3]MBC6715558.1 hypothetical protein [Aurantimonas sp. DM33-3]